MNKQIYLISVSLAFILTLSACSGEKASYANCTSFSLSDIPVQEALTGKMIESEDIIRPMKIYIKDSLLFTLRNTDEYFVSCFRFAPDNLRKIGDFIAFGSGPNEALQLISLQFGDSTVWGLDAPRSRLHQYTFRQFMTEGEITPQTSIALTNVQPTQALIVDNMIVANTVQFPDFRFSIYDMEGKHITNIGKLPDSGEKQTPLEKLESYINCMSIRPDNELIFVSYMQTDLIEMYDKNGTLKTRIHGPDHFFPARKEVSDGATKRVISKIGETRDAYFSPVAFADEIWVLYCGNFFDPSIPYSELSNRIIVFDWNGKPIRTYTTDIGIFSLDVDRENRVIYALTVNPEFGVVAFSYN